MSPPARRAREALLLALPLLVVTAPVLAGRSFFQRDLQAFTYPLKRAVRDRLLAGELPLWTPLLGLGRPVLGLVQPAPFDPLNVLLFLPWPLGMDLFNLAHLPLGALGVRAWLRAEEVDDLDATLGGLALALSGYVVSMVATNGAYAWGTMWIPWALAALRRAVDAPSARAAAGPTALGALALALTLLSGDPMAFGLGAGLVLARAASFDAPRAPRALTAALAATALGVGLCAVMLLPATEVASVGRAGGVSMAEAAQFSTRPARLIELLWPNAFGAPYSRAWFVHALYDEGNTALRDPFAAGIYLGVLTIPLALGALTRRARLDRALFVLAVLATVTALGRFGPLWPLAFRVVPGVRYFRYPEKYLFVSTLCLVALAARGLGPAAADPRRAARIAGALAVALGLAAAVARWRGADLAVALVGRLYHVPPASAGRDLAASAATAAAITFCAAGILAAAASRRWPEDRTRLALAALVALDLTVAAAPLVDTEDGAVHTRRSPVIDILRATATDPAPPRLFRQQDNFISPRELQPWLDVESLYPNAGGAEGIAQLDPIDVFVPPRERALRDALAHDLPRLAAVSGARHALVRTFTLPRWPGARAVRTFPFGFTLVEVPSPSPRLYVAARAASAPDLAAGARLIAAPGFNPGRDAVIEGGEARAAQGRCVITRYTPERVEGRCESDAPAWAVLADSAFTGWTATVNGAPAPIAPANLAMRAVRVPAGASRITFAYAPRGLGLGAAVSVASLLACVAALTLSRRHSLRARASTAAIS